MDVDGAAAGGAEEATPQGAAAAEASPAPAADGPAAAAPAAAAPVASQAPESGGKKRKYAKLPDEVSQALTAAFAANEAPDMAERKRLAAETGLDVVRVCQWFNSKRAGKKRKAKKAAEREAAAGTPAQRGAAGDAAGGFATPGTAALGATAAQAPAPKYETNEQRQAAAAECAAELAELDQALTAHGGQDGARAAAEQTARADLAAGGATLASVAVAAAEGSPLGLTALASVVHQVTKDSGMEGATPQAVVAAIKDVADRVAVGGQVPTDAILMEDATTECFWRWQCRELTAIRDAARQAQAAGNRQVCARAVARRAAVAGKAKALATAIAAYADSQDSQSIEAAAAAAVADDSLAAAEAKLRGTQLLSAIRGSAQKAGAKAVQQAAKKAEKDAERAAKKAEKDAEKATKKAEADAKKAAEREQKEAAKREAREAKEAEKAAEKAAKEAEKAAKKAEKEEELTKKAAEREEKEAAKAAAREAKEAEKAAKEAEKKAAEEAKAKKAAKQRAMFSSFFKPKPAGAKQGAGATPTGRSIDAASPQGGSAEPSPRAERPLFLKPNEYMHTSYQPPTAAASGEAGSSGAPVSLPLRGAARRKGTRWYRRRGRPGWEAAIAPERELLLYAAGATGLRDMRAERRRLDAALPEGAEAALAALAPTDAEDDDVVMADAMDAVQAAGAAGAARAALFKYLRFHQLLDSDGEWINAKRPPFWGNRQMWECHPAGGGAGVTGPTGRRPFARHPEVDYEDFSELEWSDEEEGEELGSDIEMDIEEKDATPQGSEADSFMVGDDYLSDEADAEGEEEAESGQLDAWPGDLPADALRLLQRYSKALTRAKAQGRAIVAQPGTDNAHFLAAFAPRAMSADVSIATGAEQEREVEQREAAGNGVGADDDANAAAGGASGTGQKKGVGRAAAQFSEQQLADLKAFMQELRAGGGKVTKEEIRDAFAARSGLPKKTVFNKLKTVCVRMPGQKGWFFKEPAAGDDASPDAADALSPNAGSPAAKAMTTPKGTPKGTPARATPPPGQRSVAALFGKASADKAPPTASPSTPASAVAPVNLDLNAEREQAPDWDASLVAAERAAISTAEPNVDDTLEAFSRDSLSGAGHIFRLPLHTVASIVARVGAADCPPALRASLCQALFGIAVCTEAVREASQNYNPAAFNISFATLVSVNGLEAAMRACVEAPDKLTAKRGLMLVSALTSPAHGAEGDAVRRMLAAPHWLRTLTAAVEKHTNGDFATASKAASAARGLLGDAAAAGEAAASGGSRALLDALLDALALAGAAAAAKARACEGAGKKVPPSARAVAKFAARGLGGAAAHAGPLGEGLCAAAAACAAQTLGARALLGDEAAEGAVALAEALAGNAGGAASSAEAAPLALALRAVDGELAPRATQVAAALEQAAEQGAN